MTETRKPLRCTAAALLLTAAVSGMSAAHADQIFSDSHLIQGTSVISSVAYQFSVSGPGVLTVDLQDQVWPASLSGLSFSLVTAGSTLGQFNGAGSKTFDIGAGGTLYAYVSGEATNPVGGLAYNLGLYSLDVTFAPTAVPLPAATALLLASLLGFGMLQLRPRNLSGSPSAPPQGV